MGNFIYLFTIGNEENSKAEDHSVRMMMAIEEKFHKECIIFSNFKYMIRYFGFSMCKFTFLLWRMYFQCKMNEVKI